MMNCGVVKLGLLVVYEMMFLFLVLRVLVLVLILRVVDLVMVDSLWERGVCLVMIMSVFGLMWCVRCGMLLRFEVFLGLIV